MIPSPEVRELTAKEYLHIFTKRIWVVVLCVILAAVFFTGYYLFYPKYYESKTTILIRENPLVLMDPREDPLSNKSWKKQDYQDQLNLLRSNFLAERVIRKLDLEISGQRLRAMVKVAPIFNTNMVVVSVKGKDPVKITEIANTWVREFIYQDMERRTGVAEYGISRLDNQLEETLRKLQQAERELNEYVRAHGDLAEREERVKRFRDQRMSLEKEIVEDSSRYKEKHQRMLSLNRQLDQINENLKTETNALLEVQESLAEYNVRRKKVETYREIYGELIERAKNLDTSRGLTVSDIRIIDVAEVPKVPIELPMKFTFAIWLGSLFFGIALCFGLEYMDTTLRAPEEVEFYAQMTFLADIPAVGDEFKHGEIADINLICNEQPYSLIAGAFRNLEVALIFAAEPEEPLKTVLVTSALPGEGKSFISANLATIFARSTEKPILLIDATLEEGRLSESFIKGKELGLGSVLSGQVSVEDAILETQVPNLFVLPAGRIESSIIDLMEYTRINNFIDSLKDKYEKIIIDGPDFSHRTGPIMLGEVCDGTLFVIKEESTPLKEILASRKRLLSSRSKILGAVLNKGEMMRDPYDFLHHFKSFDVGNAFWKFKNK